MKPASLIPNYTPEDQGAGCWFDEVAASRACDFFPTFLTHIKGEKAGQPFILEPWQRDIVSTIFGWKRADGTRRYREVFILVPRKNGKSTLVAGLALYLLLCDNEAGAEIYSAAADREQSRLVFDQAQAMIESSDSLRKRAKNYAHSITVKATNSFYKTVSSEHRGKHGQNPHALLIDELHVCQREFIEVLTTGLGARKQPLTIFITTSDYDRESICNEKYKYACSVRDNKGEIDKPGMDPAFLPVIYEAKLEEDWTSPEVWAKANPNLGVSVSLEYLARECKKAQEVPSYENVFRRLHLNVRTTNDVRWLSIIDWDKCVQPFDKSKLLGQVCYAGLDLSATSDVTAFVLYFPAFKVCLPFFWVPEATATSRDTRDKVPFPVWIKQGFVEPTTGNIVDYRFIRQRIQELHKLYRIKEIAYDPWSATQIALQLQDEDGFKMVEMRQGFISLSEPTKALEKLVLSNELNHLNNPVMRWMAGNVSVETDAAFNLKPSKSKSTEKIDGILALIMAIARANVDIKPTSAYSTRGLREIIL